MSDASVMHGLRYSREKTSGTNRRTRYQCRFDEYRRRRQWLKSRPVISVVGPAAAVASEAVAAAAIAAVVVVQVVGDAAGAGDGDSGVVVAVGGDPSKKGPSW